MNNTENNILIAEFMGYKERHDIAINLYINESKKSQMYVGQMKYDTDWNWLMNVVEEVEKIPSTTVEIYPNKCIITNHTYRKKFDNGGGGKKASVYYACVDYIKWYNEKIKP